MIFSVDGAFGHFRQSIPRSILTVITSDQSGPLNKRHLRSALCGMGCTNASSEFVARNSKPQQFFLLDDYPNFLVVTSAMQSIHFQLITLEQTHRKHGLLPPYSVFCNRCWGCTRTHPLICW